MEKLCTPSVLSLECPTEVSVTRVGDGKKETT